MRGERLGGLVAATIVAIGGLVLVVPRDGLGLAETADGPSRGNDRENLPRCGPRPRRDGEDCEIVVTYLDGDPRSRLLDDVRVGETLSPAEARRLVRLTRR